ncbi:hypothetical protein QJS10_CPA10g00584 [Acorus calamus]|uniref:Rx N-terminal domain-containing protein n=1 Tax=Acorus calamus TaxID=4465 RepID=A0AAV9E1U4_ACOCL|nr:hypothetical protein QJS10_CPA10g00584 [Acorus calamus]
MACLIPLLFPVVSCCKPISNAIINSIIQRFHNHISLSQNIDSLKQRIEELNGLKGSIKHMVDVAESGGLRRDNQVDVWLKRTASLEAQAGSLMECHDQNLRSCCLHLWLNWKLGQKVAHILEKVGKHKGEGAEFNKDNVAQNVLPDIVEQMIDTTVVGQALNSALKEQPRMNDPESSDDFCLHDLDGMAKLKDLKLCFNCEKFEDQHIIFNNLPNNPRELTLTSGGNVTTLDLSSMDSLQKFRLSHFDKLEELKLGRSGTPPYPPADATAVAKLINGCPDDSFS